MDVAKFTVFGTPLGKGRPRFRKNGSTYTPKKTENYENLIKLEYHNQCKNLYFDKEVPLEVLIMVYQEVPSSDSKKKIINKLKGLLRPTKKPDCDNICKIVCDALNKIAYHDDAQIVDLHIVKFFSVKPRVSIRIREAKNLEEITRREYNEFLLINEKS